MGRFGFEHGKALFQIHGGQHFEAFGFQPVAQQFAIGLVVLDDQNSMLHTFSASTGATVRCNCLTNDCCQDSCFWRSAPVFVLMYSLSRGFNSLLVSTKTGKSFVRESARHSASSWKPFTSGRTKSRITSSGIEAFTWARAAAPSAAVATAYPCFDSSSAINSRVGVSSSTTKIGRARPTCGRRFRQRSTEASNVAFSTGFTMYSSAPSNAPV